MCYSTTHSTHSTWTRHSTRTALHKRRLLPMSVHPSVPSVILISGHCHVLAEAGPRAGRMGGGAVKRPKAFRTFRTFPATELIQTGH